MTTSTVALFVDVGNLYYCISRRFDARKLDYQKLLEKAGKFGNLARSFAYGSQIQDEAVNFITCLKKLGYDTKYKKPRNSESAESGKGVRRADWGVGMAVDIVSTVSNGKCDVVILASSNPDFAPLVTWIRGQGIRCIIIACGISKELKDAADQFVEIDSDLLEE
jgi:uncharacterized LabA/DUF88 family protein